MDTKLVVKKIKVVGATEITLNPISPPDDV